MMTTRVSVSTTFRIWRIARSTNTTTTKLWVEGSPNGPISTIFRNRRNIRSFSSTNRQRLTLRPTKQKKDRGHQRRSSGQQIPLYIYFWGGTPIIGGIYLYFRYQDFAPLTGRRRWLATGPDYEKIMGKEAYQQLLIQHKNNILPRNHPLSIIIERVGKRIFHAAGKFAKENHLDYFDTNNVTFTVIDSDQANAFVLPGNHVFFLTGMFRYATTEDEIGGILGHEMAHNLARHQGEKMSGNALVSIVALMSLLVDPSGSIYTIFMPAAKILGELPHSRELELEADGIGMRLAAEACYDPEALSHVFRRMDHASKEGSDNNLTIKPPEFLSTHPSDESRIKDMQKWLPEDKRIFNMYEGERCRELRRQINATNRPLQSSSRENNWR